jgi:D-amino peptidase
VQTAGKRAAGATMTKTVLLVADLEGVAGVDDVDDLIAFSPSYPRARDLLTAEVAAAVTGLVAAGYDRVVVSDSHRAAAGRPNLVGAKLPPQAVVDYRADPYDPQLFVGVDALALVGMHAPAGSPGFAAHTVDVTSSWIAGDRVLSESEIIAGLAAEAGVPLVFAAGDDVLAAHLAGWPVVVTKHALSTAASRSEDPEKVRALLAEAALRAPVAAAPVTGELLLRLRSRWQADAAEAAGAARLDGYAVRVPGGTFADRYRGAFALTRKVHETLRAVPRVHAAEAAREDVRALLLRRADHERPPSYRSQAERALPRFLEETAGAESWQRADRAFTLAMLSRLAPVTFAAAQLEPTLAEAVAALAAIPRDFPPGLPPPEAMARVDAAWLEHQLGRGGTLDERSLAKYLAVAGSRYGMFVWLLAELAAQVGFGGVPPVKVDPRARRATARKEDLYCVTHLFMLETRYFARPVPRTPRFAALTEELIVAAPWAVAGEHVDLAAELVMCLAPAGELTSPEVRDLLALVAANQRPDGSVVDPSTAASKAAAGADAARRYAHTTAAGLIALAVSAG